MTIVPSPHPQEDDAVCADRVARWINSAVGGSLPADVHVVRIDHWFGDRWLMFAGKAAGAIGVQQRRESMTLPPFHPHRVVGRRRFRRYPDLGDYVRMPKPPRLHRRQPSEANLNRTLARLFGDVLLAWYGGGTTVDDRASLRVYRRTAAGNADPWYASFRRDLGWRPDRIVGLGEPQWRAMESYVDDPTAPA